MRRRILFLSTDRGVDVFGRKGSSVHVQSIVRAMGAAGHEVTLAATRWGEDVPADLGWVVRGELPPAPRGQGEERERAALAWDASLGMALAGLPRVDLVYERHALWSSAGMAFARAVGVPGVLEVNAPLIEEQQRYRSLVHVAEAEAATRRAFAAATRIVCVSEEVAAYVRAYGGDPDVVQVIPNGVDVARFPPRVRRASAEVVLGFVGTLKPWHGTEHLIDAVGLLRERGRSVRAVIVGDGPEAAALEARADALGVAAFVSFVGAVKPAEVPGYLAEMDVAVAPYPDLPGMYFSPLKVFEYLAAGVATVASDVGQIGRLLRHERAVVLVAPGDAAALAAAVGELADDPARREALGAAGRAWVGAHQTWDSVWARSVAGVFGEVAG